MVGFCVYGNDPLVSIQHGHIFLRRTVLFGANKLILNGDIVISLKDKHFTFNANESIFVQFYPVPKYYDFL